MCLHSTSALDVFDGKKTETRDLLLLFHSKNNLNCHTRNILVLSCCKLLEINCGSSCKQNESLLACERLVMSLVYIQLSYFNLVVHVFVVVFEDKIMILDDGIRPWNGAQIPHMIT